jgi:Uncharacterised nucleotidyltransferase
MYPMQNNLKLDLDPGILPTTQQERLLKSAIWSGEAATAIWKEWKQFAGSERPDTSSERLFPLVYRNLSAQLPQDRSLQNLRSFYQTTWYRNQMLFKNAEKILKAFSEARIPVLLLKGAPLTLLYYKSFGVRPMDDVDVLVRRENAQKAASLLLELGFIPKDYSWLSALANPWFYDSRHAQNFVGQDCEIDLHWHVFPYTKKAEDDALFWNAAEKIQFRNLELFAMHPADLLLHVCVHGANWYSTPILRWAADAAQIIKKCERNFDWSRMIAQAERYQVSLALHHALSYLRFNLELGIPEDVLVGLNSSPSVPSERILFWATSRFPGPAQKAIFLGTSHFRNFHHRNLSEMFHSVGAFHQYLRYRWGCEQPWLIPFHALTKSVKHAWVVLKRAFRKQGIYAK